MNDLKTFNSVSALRYWCYKILPMVYDDSLSYYEILCKVTEKLNEVISNTNNIPSIISEAVASGGFLDNLQEQIAELNDKDSKTATADRNTGELTWLNGNLYRITRPMLAGDQYVEDSNGATGNIEKITVEEWIERFLNYVKTAITVNDQNYNIIADKAIKTGTLLWWKGSLYQTTKDIVLNGYLSTDTNLKSIDLETILNDITKRLDNNEKYPIYYPAEEKMVFRGSFGGSPVIKTTADTPIYDQAENYLSKFEMSVDNASDVILVKDSGARSSVAQEIADRSKLIKTDDSGNTLIITKNKITESAHKQEITITDTRSTHVDGANTVNIGGPHTEVYASTYGKTVTGKNTIHYNGESEEVHKLPAKITAPDLTLDIKNGITYKKPVKYNNYFNTVPAKDTDGNIYRLLVASDSTQELGNSAPYHSYKEFGIDNTGKVDCSTILEAITDNVALASGTYLINSDCSINAQVVFAKGAIITGTGKITFNVQPTAGTYKIFENKNVVLPDYALADWFNSLNNAYMACSTVILMPHSYTLNNDLTIDKTNSAVIGIAFCEDHAPKKCVINTGNYHINIGTTNKPKIEQYPRGITLKNMTITHSGTSAIIVNRALQSELSDLYITTSGAETTAGITYNNGVTITTKNVYVQLTQTNGYEAFGFRIKNTTSNNLLDRNASLFFEKCFVGWYGTATHNNSYGFFISATAPCNVISDIMIRDCEIISTAVGINFDGMKNATSFNLKLHGLVIDNPTAHALAVFNSTTGIILCSNCYFNNNSELNNTEICRFVNSPVLINFNGCEFTSGATSKPAFDISGSCNLFGDVTSLSNVKFTTSNTSGGHINLTLQSENGISELKYPA